MHEVVIDWLSRGQTWVLGYFFLVNGLYGLLLTSAAFELFKHRKEADGERLDGWLSSPVLPRVSLIAPAFNEEATLVASVRSLLALGYPNLQVVVVNDGSTDSSLSRLQEAFALATRHPIFRRQVQTAPIQRIFRSTLYPGLTVVDKVNGGKADALNAGLNVADGELVCAMDADTLIESDALLKLVRPFLRSDRVVAVGGTIRVANGCRIQGGHVQAVSVPRRALAGIQVIEYLRAFLFGRLGWNRLGGNLIVSGAFGLFRRLAVVKCGGYRHDTVGEDMDLVVRLRKQGMEEGTADQAVFIPDPVAWTEVPGDLQALARQRDRWQRGLFDVIWRHRGILFNFRYKAMGLVVAPYFLVVELLAPLVEGLGLLAATLGTGLGLVDWKWAAWFFLLAYGLGLILSVATLLLEELGFRRYNGWQERMWLLGWAVLENLGYRQITVYWRLKGMYRFLRGNLEWGEMTRKGFAGEG